MPIDSKKLAEIIVSQYLPEAKLNVDGTENLASIIRGVFASGVAYGANQTKNKVVSILVSEYQAGNVESEALQSGAQFAFLTFYAKPLT